MSAPAGRRSGAGTLSSIRPASGSAPGSPKPPARSTRVALRGSSSSASGLPLASATIGPVHPGVDRRGQHRIEQRSCVAIWQAAHGEFRQSG